MAKLKEIKFPSESTESLTSRLKVVIGQSTLALLPLSLLCLVQLNFCLPFSGPCSQDFLAFSLSQAKEVFYASPRICSSFQYREEPLAHFEKRFCLVFGSKKWHCRKLCYHLTIDVMFMYLRNYRIASMTNQNARFYPTMRSKIHVVFSNVFVYLNMCIIFQNVQQLVRLLSVNHLAINKLVFLRNVLVTIWLDR